jgi:glyceraldehyde-3-phosphate dehydrogenase (NADP+) (phosphorylating)
VAINGFGRIGRNFVRCWHGRGAASNLEVVAINDSGGVKQASHLLKYDSMLGTFSAEVKVISDTEISVAGKKIQIVSARDPLQLPWKAMNIDLVIEGTGVFIDTEGAGKHITAGAKKVLITAPGKGKDIPTYVVGVNADQYKHSDVIISNASCTTNCLAPFAKVLDEKFGIVKGTMTTTHSYTGDQRLLDASHRDLRRARAAALNIVPTSTGAAKAVALVLPGLKGKLNGIALRVPTPNVSVVDLVIQTEKKTFAEEVNAAFREAAAGPMKGVLAVCDEPLVSVDFRMTDVSTSIDSSLTMVMGDDMVKVVAWYDNEVLEHAAAPRPAPRVRRCAPLHAAAALRFSDHAAAALRARRRANARPVCSAVGLHPARGRPGRDLRAEVGVSGGCGALARRNHLLSLVRVRFITAHAVSNGNPFWRKQPQARLSACQQAKRVAPSETRITVAQTRQRALHASIVVQLGRLDRPLERDD